MPPIDFPTRSSLSRIPSPADISLDFSPNIRLTEVFLAKTGEYPLGTVQVSGFHKRKKSGITPRTPYALRTRPGRWELHLQEGP